jgi:hypothetical protein
MPKAHQKNVGRTPSRLIEDPSRPTPNAARLVEAILAAKRHPEMGCRPCLGILRLAKIYECRAAERKRNRGTL